MSELVQGFLMTAMAAAAFLWSTTLPPSRTAVPGAGFYPELVSGLGIVLGLIVLGRATWALATRQRLDETDGEPHDWLRYLRIGGPIIIAAALFVFAFERIGFLLSSFAFLVVALVLLGERRAWLIALVSALLSAGVYFLFNSVLQLPLPRGSVFG